MLFDYPTLQVLWWALVGVVLIILALTMGFDLGIGMLLPFIGKNDTERRVALNVIGPTWDGNQVWLIFGGGAIFCVWPMVYATAFSGFYVAMLALLWSLFLRPVGFEYRSKMPNAMWRRCWDLGIFVGSFVPALILGVAFGNLLRGVPFSFDETFRMTYGGTFLGLLNPFAIIVGLVSVTMLVMHGAAFLAVRTEGIIQQRCRKAVSGFAWLYILLFALAGLWIAYVLKGYTLLSFDQTARIANPFDSTVVVAAGAWLANYKTYHWMIVAPVLGFLGALLAFIFALAEKYAATFWSSCLAIAGTILTAGFSMFPYLIPSSSHPKQSLTVWNATSNAYSLNTLLIAAIILLPLIAIYTTFVYRKMWGTISNKTIEDESHLLY